MQQFLVRQPAAPQETATDAYYLQLANRLVAYASDNRLFHSYPEKVVERAAMTVIGYYQDVICDAGIWRSFITECRRMYGFTVPFYDNGTEGYTDYELNRIDVKFMVWYSLSMNYEERRVCYPFDDEIMAGADAWWGILEECYDESPMPEDYRIAHELEMHAKEDSEAIYKLGNWLFMHCYLMTPAYAMTLSEVAASVDLSKEENFSLLQEKLEQSMMEDPTGPFALYLGEWLHLVVSGKLPRQKKNGDEKGEHKYYTAFTKATGGEIMKIFGSYDEMNEFFISALGWASGEEHLSQAKGAHDYILMVNPQKGMLMARDIARCIAKPGNDLYDKGYAEAHAMDLLTIRGCCPGDLLQHILTEGWLPDAVFPGTNDKKLVAGNSDFISRCYLQQYYRGD